MITSKLKYLKAKDVNEAVTLYSDFEGEAVYLSGGSDLIPRMKLGLEKPKALIDLKSIDSLHSIEDEGDWIRIGSLSNLYELKQNQVIQDFFPALRESLEATSCETLQMRGTIGGNILQDCRCLFYNQSEFWRSSKGYCLKMGGDKCNAVPGAKNCFANYCSDNATSLSTLSPELELSGPSGSRRILLDELYTNKSQTPFNLQPGEILTAIFIPKKKTIGGYEKLRIRGAIDYPLLGVGFSLIEGHGKLTIGAVGARPITVEVKELDEQAFGQAVEAVLKQVTPVNNTVVDKDYRKRMIPILTEGLVKKVMEGAK